jgi:hypothetical protein
MSDKTKKIVSLIILLVIIVGFIGYKLYERTNSGIDKDKFTGTLCHAGQSP